MASKRQLSISLCGINLSNPLILGAGPYGRDSETLTRAANAGFGAVTTKTIRLVSARSPYPNIARTGRDMLVNAEKWSDVPYQTWVKREIPRTKRIPVPLIVSVGFTAKEAEKIAPLVEEAGADFIETVTYDANQILPMVKTVKSLVKAPVIVKVSANWQNVTKIAVKAEKLGADVVSAIDSVGPVLAIDVETGKPSLGSANGEGWISGSAIHHIALRYVAEIARKVKIPIIGIGGVSSGRGVVEMIMAGADCVGMCTSPIVHGLQIVERTKSELADFMKLKGYSTLREMRGLTLKHLKNLKRELKGRVHPQINADTCTLCGLCASLCPYGALVANKEKILPDMGKCLSCGLCYSVCPHQAITLAGR